MPDALPPFTITLDTHDPALLASFYCDRLGFEHVETISPGVMFERHRLLHREMGVGLELRSCLPRPHVGSTPGSLFELTFRVDDPEKAAEGLHIESRVPEEGPADALVVRDPGNYLVLLERA